MLYSAAEQAYREVKELILSGGLPGGELISGGVPVAADEIEALMRG